jgi:DNA-binding NtrC family response regulator
MCNAQEIQPRHLPEEFRDSEPISRDDNQVAINIGSSLNEVEAVLIRATLQKVNGNKSKAADILGVGRKTLYRKMEEYGIE